MSVSQSIDLVPGIQKSICHCGIWIRAQRILIKVWHKNKGRYKTHLGFNPLNVKTRKMFCFLLKLSVFRKLFPIKIIREIFLEKQKKILHKYWKNEQENFVGKNRKIFCTNPEIYFSFWVWIEFEIVFIWSFHHSQM